MAIWQYDFELVPRTGYQKRPAEGARRCDEARPVTNCWENTAVPPELEPRLSTLLPPGESWSTSVRVWGASDGDRVDLCFEEQRLVEFNVRLDLRYPSGEFFHGILCIAREYGYLVRTPGGRLLEPDATSVLSDIVKSPAAAFVKDPHGFIQGLQ